MRKWLLLVFWTSWLGVAEATTIDPRIWQQLVVDADFVGVIECITAGGIVAEYEVVDSWKGAPAGERFRLRIAVNYWEPQFPIALVGERFLVTAFGRRPPSSMVSTTSGGGVPLWARDLPADYQLPLFQGRVRLPLSDTDYALSPLGSEETNLDRFKASVNELLGSPPETREMNVLKALTHKYLVERAGNEPLPGIALEVRNAVRGAVDLASVLASLARLPGIEESRWPFVYAAIVGQGGGAASLGLGLPEDVAASIRERMGREEPVEEEPPGRHAVPSDEELSRLTVDENLELLTRHRPRVVADYLRNWVNRDESWMGVDHGYVLGSFFAILLEGERLPHLRSLLSARDPFIRVAAAVYLTLEDQDDEEGLRSLREHQHLEGDPGVWAALSLARRGERDVVPRLLRVFDETGESNMAGAPHRNLQKRVLVLLSNSAAHSGVPQPIDSQATARIEEGSGIDINTLLDAWWQRHRARVRLADPWLAELRLRRVD